MKLDHLGTTFGTTLWRYCILHIFSIHGNQNPSIYRDQAPPSGKPTVLHMALESSELSVPSLCLYRTHYFFLQVKLIVERRIINFFEAIEKWHPKTKFSLLFMLLYVLIPELFGKNGTLFCDADKSFSYIAYDFILISKRPRTFVYLPFRFLPSIPSSLLFFF